MKEVLLLQSMEVKVESDIYENGKSTLSFSCKKESTVSLFICVLKPE